MRGTTSALMLAAAITASSSATARAMEPQAKPAIVLVRDASAESFGSNAVTARLNSDGHAAIAAANPLRRLAGPAISAIVRSISGPVVLVGYLRDHDSRLALLDLGPGDARAGRGRSLSGCKSQWRLADLNGDGVLDAREVAHYNSALRSAAQAPLSDADRPTEMGFIAECTTTTAHE